MSWKVNLNNRCPHCYLRHEDCICDEVEKVDNKTRLVLVMHKREVKSLSNSGRLALLTYKNSFLRIRGEIDRKTDLESVFDPSHTNLVLFPSPEAQPLTTSFVKDLGTGPKTLYVPDGNWSQAGKFIKREPLAQHFIKVSLPFTERSRYFLRASPHKEKLGTAEAIARAMKILEGPEVSEPLEKIFAIMVKRVLRSRAKQHLLES